MKAEDLDKLFDDGEVDINDYLDLAKAFRPGQEPKRVNIDFPQWMVGSLDKESKRLGVPRQSAILRFGLLSALRLVYELYLRRVTLNSV